MINLKDTFKKTNFSLLHKSGTFFNLIQKLVKSIPRFVFFVLFHFHRHLHHHLLLLRLINFLLKPKVSFRSRSLVVVAKIEKCKNSFPRHVFPFLFISIEDRVRKTVRERERNLLEFILVNVLQDHQRSSHSYCTKLYLYLVILV